MSTMPAGASPFRSRGRLPRLAESAANRARLAAAPMRKVPSARAPFVMLVITMLGLGVAGLLTFNTAMQQNAFAQQKLDDRAKTLAAKEQSLEMELAGLRDPQHVAAAAKKLGMVPPPNPAFLRLRDGRILGDPQPAVATDSMRITPAPATKPKNLAPKPKIVKVVLTPKQARAQERLRKARAEVRKARQESRQQQAAR